MKLLVSHVKKYILVKKTFGITNLFLTRSATTLLGALRDDIYVLFFWGGEGALLNAPLNMLVSTAFGRLSGQYLRCILLRILAIAYCVSK